MVETVPGQVVGGPGNREFAADREIGALARDGGDGRFGQNMGDAIALERLQRRRHGARRIGKRDAARLTARGRGDVAVDAEGIVLRERAPGARRQAQLLGDTAVDFGDGDFQHHLIAPVNDQGIDDHSRRRAVVAVEVLGEALSDIVGALGLFRGINVAGEDDRVVDRAGGNIRRRHGRAQDLLQFADVPADVDLQCRDLVALGIKREDRGLALVEADDIELAGRADDGIGDLGIADEDFGRILGQIDDQRLADAHRYAPRETGVAPILDPHTGLREGLLHRRKHHQRCG